MVNANNTFFDATSKLDRATRELDSLTESNWERQTSAELYHACKLYASKYELRKQCVGY